MKTLHLEQVKQVFGGQSATITLKLTGLTDQSIDITNPFFNSFVQDVLNFLENPNIKAGNQVINDVNMMLCTEAGNIENLTLTLSYP